MSKDKFDLPDMDDLTNMMKDAMEQAEEAMDNLPDQMEGMENIMGSLSSLMDGMPSDLSELTGAINGFSEQHEENSAALAGTADWSLEADIQIGSKIHVLVSAGFDLKKVTQAWNSTQNSGFESLVGGVVEGAGIEADDDLMGQIMGQLKKGRSIALIKNIEVLECRIQGAPGNAAGTLQLSPEGNIPLTMSESGLGFEFAPMLTIRNKWENANIPTFKPMAECIVVSSDLFEAEKAFILNFEPDGQDDEIMIKIKFQKLH